MGQVHHGCATTTAAVRRAIQHSQESLRVLARRHGISPKTVAKWKARGSVVQNLVRRIEGGGGAVFGVVLNKRRFFIPRFVYSKI